MVVVRGAGGGLLYPPGRDLHDRGLAVGEELDEGGWAPEVDPCVHNVARELGVDRMVDEDGEERDGACAGGPRAVRERLASEGQEQGTRRDAWATASGESRHHGMMRGVPAHLLLRP